MIKHCREGTNDQYTVKEVRKNYRTFELKGAYCLDIGGHIGSFADFADSQGAIGGEVFEPNPANFPILSENLLDHPNWRAVNAAVVGGGEAEVEFFLPTTVNFTSGSRFMKRGRKSIRVAAVSLASIFQNARQPFTCVKIDCEGGEYDFLPFVFPDSVRTVGIEWHLSQKAWKEAWPQNHQDFLTQGFKTASKPPKLDPNHVSWYTVQIYTR